MIAESSPTSGPARDLVLIVDDDQAVCDALKFALELDGLSVVTCDSGAALLRHPALSRAGCLVLDYQMPGMNGFAVMNELRRRDVKLPIILITAPLSRDVEERATAAGVAGVLEKPLLENVLLDKIRHIL